VNFLSIVIISIISMFLLRCGPTPIPNRSIMPEEFKFVIADKGIPLITSQEFKLEVYYFKGIEKKVLGGECTECKMIRPFDTTNPDYKYYYSTLEAPLASGRDSIKDFYIKIGNDVDTVFLDVQPLPLNDPSGGSYYYKQVKFNGREVKINESVFPWTYIFKK